MPVHLEADHQIRNALAAYCHRFDRAEFREFARLFEHGRWFMVDSSGVEPVLSWVHDHVILYDGRPRTRHEMANVEVEVADDDRLATFRCYLTIWQHLPGRNSEMLAQARFAGTFAEENGQWWWHSHEMIPDFVGDLSTHLRGLQPA